MQTETGTDIDKALNILQNDGIIGFPTETVYGLACNAFSEKAVKRIYALKGRDFKKPLTVQVDSFEKIKIYVRTIPAVYVKIAKKYCPGPVTFIFNKNELIPGIVTAGLETIGIRIPDHPMAMEILTKINFPLAVTSANLSGKPESITAKDMNGYFNYQIPYIIDGGKCLYGKPSTVVSCRDEHLIILREGPFKIHYTEKH